MPGPLVAEGSGGDLALDSCQRVMPYTCEGLGSGKRCFI